MDKQQHEYQYHPDVDSDDKIVGRILTRRQALSLGSLAGLGAMIGCGGGATTVSSGSDTAPAITTQPTSQTVALGTSASFTVVATGGNLSYKWYKDSIAITGATSATYTISSVVAGSAGSYYVVVSNSLGSANSLQYPGSSCGGSLTIGDPDLLPLSDNGGLTRTMALVWGSPAVNAGDNQVCALLDNKDQRGMSRQTFGKTCDIGAFELQGK